jgi:hypothetical protein
LSCGAADDPIGYTLLLDSDLMLDIEPRHDRTASPPANAAHLPNRTTEAQRNDEA